MITEAIVEAMDAMIDACSSDEQRKGMQSMREMLCDFDEAVWECTSEDERLKWIELFLSCAPKKEVI